MILAGNLFETLQNVSAVGDDFAWDGAGALTAVSRYLGDNLKIGLGYNFADFSDDLTDLDYDHQGFFLNLTGTM